MVKPNVPPKYPYSNCIYIEDERSAVIDFGAGRDAFLDVPRDKVKLGLMSHFHFDHVHSNVLFPSAEMWAGHEEKHTYSSSQTYIEYHGYDLWEEIMGIDRINYGDAVPLPDDVPTRPGFREIKLEGTFYDGKEIKLGRRRITAIHLPGHTKGHYGFYFPEEEILFSGDIDLVASGPWYSSNSGDVGELMESVQRIKNLNPRVLVPSHRRVIKEGIVEGLNRYIQVVINRDDAIMELLKEPKNLDQLSKYGLVFPQANNMYDVFWEKMTIRNHLRRLLRLKEVIEMENGVYCRR